uniref:Zinc transporter 2 n=1 Tax=Glossina brevipalpis TaxID=37001 RepID=A0A1A9WQV5_9MUSC
MSKYQILNNDFDYDEVTAETSNEPFTLLLFNSEEQRKNSLSLPTQSTDHYWSEGNNSHHLNKSHNRRYDDCKEHNNCNGNVLQRSQNDNSIRQGVAINNNNNKNNNNNNNDNVTVTNMIMSANYIKNCNKHNAIDSAMTPLDADESVIEVPLIQKHTTTTSVHDSSNTSNTHNQIQFMKDYEHNCLCGQAGFSANLRCKSTQAAKTKILWAIVICCIFMIVEFLGGYIAGSLAIMTDAAHLASDCISFIIGLVAIWLGSRPPDDKMSFGYKRMEIIGAIASILGIWILTATLVLMALQRLCTNDYDLDANTMMTISFIGILINIVMIFILHTSTHILPTVGIAEAHGHSHSHNHGHGHSPATANATTSPTMPLHRPTCTNDNRSLLSDVFVDTTSGTTSMELLSPEAMVLNGSGLKHQTADGNDKNLNLRAAMIHVIGDLVQSFGVFLASVLIKNYPQAVFLDPLCTLLFSIIVIMTTVNLFKESIHVLMDSVPQEISLNDLKMDLYNLVGVKSVYHLNIWNHTSNHKVLMAHLVIDSSVPSNTVLFNATRLVQSPKYNIKHSTIQIETEAL